MKMLGKVMPRADAPMTATVFGSNSGLKRSRTSRLISSDIFPSPFPSPLGKQKAGIHRHCSLRRNDDGIDIGLLYVSRVPHEQSILAAHLQQDVDDRGPRRGRATARA